MAIDAELLVRTSVMNADVYEVIGDEQPWIRAIMCFAVEERDGPFLCVSVNVDERDRWTGATQYASSHGGEQRAKERVQWMVRAQDVCRCEEYAGGVCEKVRTRDGDV